MNDLSVHVLADTAVGLLPCRESLGLHGILISVEGEPWFMGIGFDEMHVVRACYEIKPSTPGFGERRFGGENNTYTHPPILPVSSSENLLRHGTIRYEHRREVATHLPVAWMG